MKLQLPVHDVASFPVLPTPAFALQPWRKSEEAGVGRTGNEAIHDAQSSATSTRNPRLLYEQTSTASGHNTLHCSTGINLLNYYIW